jgi:excisionase family DNA binding protein
MSKPDNLSTYVTPAEAAKILRVSRKTIYKLLDGGDLKSVRVGGQHRIPRAALAPKGAT